MAFSLIKASDLILVDHKGEVIDGGECRLLNTAAYMIHHAVHEARPDVMCAAHSHSIYGRTFCALGRKLDTITQDSCAFHNDLALYESFNGVVLAEEEGKDIAKALGGQKAALLQNHGLLTVGKTIEEAVFWFVSLEKCCHSQLMADAAVAGRGGATVKIGEEEAMYTRKTVGSTMAGTSALLLNSMYSTLTTSRLLLSKATLRCHSQGKWWRLLGVSMRALWEQMERQKRA